MKILALRGENLASLQSRFEIDFSGSTLGTAGLFAITGRTGAGKSTLLDAICLALYGAIPRLQSNKKNDAEIGRDDDDNRIKANDVRSILSRGKGEGFTEVDFLADDGTRWRAHWSVRRARAKAEGRIQTAEQWLENLNTSQRFAGKKQELQHEIQRLIGLSFEQFRRAVMLPQGEFAAFLKAPTNDRAELLERMTGGEIYSRVSVLAYERARTEKEAYQQLRAKLGDVTLLSDDEKQVLTTRTETLKQQTSKLSAQLDELKQHQNVLTATEKLRLRISKAEDFANTSQQAADTAQPRQQYLTLVEKVQPARSDYSLLQQAGVQLEKLQHTLSTTQAEWPATTKLKQDSDEQVTSAIKALAQTKQEWQILEPDLRAAQKLEQQCENMQQQLEALQQEQKQRQRSASEQEQRLAQLQSQQAELQHTKTTLSDKLAKDQPTQTITEQFQAVKDNVAQYLSAQRTQAQLRADKTQINAEQLNHKQQQDDLTVKLKTLADN
ncbi:MAG: AAA family ATPase, partial [Thiolinea sp.]